MTDTKQATHDFTLTWVLPAAPEDVFRAWTDPGQLDWFYNDGQPVPDAPIELDLRVGGAWRQLMVIDETTSYVTGGVYREIVPGRRLVFAWGAEDGWPDLDPVSLDESPLVTLALEPVEQGTELTLHVEFPGRLPTGRFPVDWFGYAPDGWRVTVDRLAAALER